MKVMKIVSAIRNKKKYQGVCLAAVLVSEPRNSYFSVGEVLTLGKLT